MRRHLSLRLLAASAVVVGSSAIAVGCGSSTDKSTDTTMTPGANGDGGVVSGDGAVGTGTPGDDGGNGGQTGTGGDSGGMTGITGMGTNTSTCAPANVFLNPAVSTPVFADAFNGVAAGDLNKDGRTDLVYQGTNKNAFTVYLSKGDGTFTSTPYPIGALEAGNGTLFELADVDGDGNLDLLTAGTDTVSDQVMVRRGKGDGTLADGAIASPALAGPIEFAQFGDLNGDGNLDMVAMLQDAAYAILGTGSGMFSAGVALAPIVPNTDVSRPFRIVDMNKDGKLDLAYVDSAGICVAFGSGSGGFGTAACAPGSTNVLQQEAIQVADFNNDGNPDIVLGNFSTDFAANVFLNKGAGVFNTFTTLDVPGYSINDVVVGDFNNDKNQDIAVYQRDAFSLALLNGKGDGTFATTPQILATAQNVYSPVLVGNFLGDGLPGIAVADGAYTKIDVINATCRTTLPAAAQVGTTVAPTCATAKVTDGTLNALTATSSEQAVVAVDLDGDGKMDILQSGGSTGKAFSWAISNGDGTFKPVAELEGDGNGSAIVAGDVNGDGKADVIFPGDPSHYYVSLNMGGAGTALTFSTPVEYGLPDTAQGQEISTAEIADVNNDGHLDVLLDNHLLLGLGDGTFAGYGALESFLGTTSRVVTADLNGDKQLDLAYIGTTSTSQAGFCVALNIGNANFATPTCTAGTAGGDLHDLDAADINGDGKMDIVVANSNATAALNVFLGKGDGTFGSLASYDLPTSGTASVRLHDFDNDGKVDALVWNSNDGTFTLAPGAGDGTFSGTAKSFAGGVGGNETSQDLAIGDFTGTGLYGWASPDQAKPAIDVYVAKCSP